MDPILMGFVGYLLLVIAVGFTTVRYTKTLADFLLAGRRLGAWVVALSERASGEKSSGCTTGGSAAAGWGLLFLVLLLSLRRFRRA